MTEQTRSFDPLQIPLAGVHAIAASAGTGKTYTIATLYVRYLLEHACPIDQILVTTFTEAATAELKDRLRARVREALDLLQQCETPADAVQQVNAGGADAIVMRLLEQAGGWMANKRATVEERLREALLNFDHAPIFTIHGFCNRVLQELVFETASRFDLELVTSEDTLIEEAVADFIAARWTAEGSLLARWLPLDEGRWGAMRNIAAESVDNPGFPVVPDHRELDPLLESPLFEEFDQAARQLTDLWQQHRDQVCEILFDAREQGWLNGNTHGRSGQLERSIQIIDDLAADPTPELFEFSSDGSLEPDYRRLMQSALEAGTKKTNKANAPRHAVYQSYEGLAEVVVQIHEQRRQIQPRLLARLAHEVRGHVVRRKRQLGVMSFSDLLHHVDEALHGPQQDLLLASLRDRYRVALVDEFQDTDPVQYRIFQRVFHIDSQAKGDRGDFRSFVMIGDPKQSIYRFRGADIHSYLRATDDTPKGNRHTLGTNWRSDRSLVAGVQRVFKSRRLPFVYENIPLPDVDAHFPDRLSTAASLEFTLIRRDPLGSTDKQLDKRSSLKQVIWHTCEQIVQQLNDPPVIAVSETKKRPIVPGDLAVLCRTGRQLRMIQAELAGRGVPAVLQTDESIFDTAEAESAIHVLRAIQMPGDLMLQTNALATSLFGLNADQLEGVRNDEGSLSQWGERFFEWHELWLASGFIAMWRRLLDQQGVVARLAAQLTGERRVTNYLHLGELLHRQAVTAHAGPDQLLRWLEQAVADPQSRSDDESQLRLETDAAAVQLCTIHRSKGLEYPIVYCPTLWDSYGGGAPKYVIARLDDDLRPLETPLIDVGSDLLDQRISLAERESAAEDRRLLYVALTRARHQCRVLWIAANESTSSALAQLMFESPDKKATDVTLETQIKEWTGGFGVPRVAVGSIAEAASSLRATRYQPPPQPTVALASRPIVRSGLPRLVKTSFSSLARHVEQTDDWAIADHDLLPPSAAVTEPDEPQQTVPLAAMPGGVRVGDLVHRVFEDVLNDPRRHGGDHETIHGLVQEYLAPGMTRCGLESQWLDPLADSLTGCLTGAFTDVDAQCYLAGIPPESMRCELHFLLRVADYEHAMNTTEIGGAFELSSNEFIRSYGQRVARIAPLRLRGFLEGFIDVVFRWNGRWYLLDYKTNQLGPATGDYSRAKLEQAMFHHDYILQYHLYAVALDRFLKQRLPEYQYERDFGGAVYQFVRGFGNGDDASQGVYFDRPEASVVERLAALIAC